MTALPNRAEILFEEQKDDPRVQAILKQIGTLRKYVIEWEMDSAPVWKSFGRRYIPEEQVIYRIVLQDRAEIHGEVLFVPQLNEWIASGRLIPKEYVP